MITDWEILAKQIGSLNESGESGGDVFAQHSFELILGDEWIENTVEFILGYQLGSELAMSCLRLLNSAKAANYAYRVYKSSDGERADRAVWLIKHIANPVSFEWVEEFLNDSNVIHWGIGVLDQLLWTKTVAYDDRAKALLELADKNSNGQSKNNTDWIRHYMEEENGSF